MGDGTTSIEPNDEDFTVVESDRIHLIESTLPQDVACMDDVHMLRVDGADAKERRNVFWRVDGLLSKKSQNFVGHKKTVLFNGAEKRLNYSNEAGESHRIL